MTRSDRVRSQMLARASLGPVALARGTPRPVHRLLDHEGIAIVGLRSCVRDGVARA